jgi:hypothetical protein
MPTKYDALHQIYYNQMKSAKLLQHEIELQPKRNHRSYHDNQNMKLNELNHQYTVVREKKTSIKF